jgi:dipeptidyl aminopeptidase/acylaminoacyl peptidase
VMVRNCAPVSKINVAGLSLMVACTRSKGKSYVRDGTTRTLVAQPFDLRKFQLAGEPISIAEQVYGFSTSLTDTLLYSSTSAGHRQLTLFDREGKILGTVGDPGDYDDVAFSPDGKRAVVARLDVSSNSENFWMIDLIRGISTRFTFDSATDGRPVWSPDGSSIVFASSRGGGLDTIYRKLSNGGGNDELLFKSDYSVAPVSWSNDGRFLLVNSSTATSDQNMSVLPLDANGYASGKKPFIFVQEGVGGDGQFSPGPAGHPRWVAYTSDESGRSEIYVRPFDSASPTGTASNGGKWQVSAEGGVSPRWNKNGKELFYIALDGTVMSVEVGDTMGFRPGTPTPLFRPRGFSTPAKTEVYWDVSPDAKKFIFAVSPPINGTAAPVRLSVVLNWTSLLKK